MRWPGRVKAGTRTAQIGHVIDILPTCLELAHENYPSHFRDAATTRIDGQSLVSIWETGTRTAPAQLCWEWNCNCAIRQGRWKLVWDTLNPARKWQLYDMHADRSEVNDLAGQEPAQVENLIAACEEWARATGRPDRRLQRSDKSGYADRRPGGG